MKIAIIADPIDMQTAGIHFYTKRLIEALLKQKAGDEYIFIHPKENPFFEKTTHYILPRKKHILGYETYRRWIKIPSLLKKINPDIVIETSHIGPFRIPKNSKKVTIIHDLTPIIFPQFHIGKSVIIHKLALPHIFKTADLIVTPSENTKTDILRLYKTKNNIAVIHEGIDPPLTKSISPIIPPPYLLYLGTIEPRKNLNILIDAFLELKKSAKIPQKLVLAGGMGWKNKELLEKVAKNKDIVLTGYISDIEKASLYKHADAFVYPSLYEGFGLPPLEAMSYGVPVICSTGGSLKEIFSKHALMFDPNDKETLKKHILSVISTTQAETFALANHPRSSRGSMTASFTKDGDSRLRGNDTCKNTLEYSKQFTWEKTAKKFVEELRKLI